MSASLGCRLCTFILSSLSQSTDRSHPFGFPSSDALKHVSEKYPGRQISLAVWGTGPDAWLDRIRVVTTGEIEEVEDEDEESYGTDPSMHPDHQIALSGVLDLLAYPDDPAAWRGEIRGRALPKTAGDSEEDFALATQWLNDCLCNHVSCSKSTLKGTKLPTRVLDIGPADGSQEPYLLETHGKYGCYIALSHCWGGHVPITTTSGTISERKQCIPLASLPKTFKEAVLVSRKLDVRYLWIDSLCIIQDLKSDWETESALMGDVYGQSYLTVAARGAAGPNIGCFIPREEEPPACTLTYLSEDGAIKGQMHIRDPTFQTERLDRSPLDQRGWVLQEKILPPRILYYGAQQLYWECSSTSLRQDGKFFDVDQDQFRTYAFKHAWDPDAPSKPKFHNSNYALKLDGLQVERLQRMCKWYLIVEEYTRRKLTFTSDKLPAIAGVAKKFHRRTEYLYIAGLWKEDLLSGILWFRIGGLNDAPISTKLPSWSWARFGGQMRFWNPVAGLIRVLDTDCVLLDLSYNITDSFGNYGEVENARIEVNGRVLHVVTVAKKGNDYPRHIETLCTKKGAVVGWPNFDIPGAHDVGFECFCLLVDQGYGSAAGLALEKVEGKAMEYRRIGYVRIPTGLNDDETDGRMPFQGANPQVISIL